MTPKNDCEEAEEVELTSHMDHITYVCRTGEIQGVLEWYARVFGMKRFMISPQETVDDGEAKQHT